MHSFGFKVIPSEDGASGVPVAVAGQSMVDIQRLLTDIGSMMVRVELRIQNDVPESLLKKFELSIGGSSADGLGSDPGKGSEQIVEDALNSMCATLDFLGKGLVDSWLIDNYPEPMGRKQIAADLVALSDNLVGYTLVYGPSDNPREFRGLDREKVLEFAQTDVSSLDTAVIGVVSRDPVRKNRWLLSNGPQSVPVSFSDNISPSDVPAFASAGPVIVTGTVVRNDGVVSEVRNVNGCYSFPEVKFHRMETPGRDIILLNPSIARPTYNAAKGLWNLVNDDLGIDVSKPSWDECVLAYHEYFEFLWETYYESDDEFEGEEKDIQDFLASLAPVL